MFNIPLMIEYTCRPTAAIGCNQNNHTLFNCGTVLDVIIHRYVNASN